MKSISSKVKKVSVQLREVNEQTYWPLHLYDKTVDFF